MRLQGTAPAVGCWQQRLLLHRRLVVGLGLMTAARSPVSFSAHIHHPPAAHPVPPPAAFLRAVLAFMRPFVSKKAGRKIKQVQSLDEIAAATEGEVTLQSLGPAFAEDQLAVQLGGADLAP